MIWIELFFHLLNNIVLMPLVVRQLSNHIDLLLAYNKWYSYIMNNGWQISQPTMQEALPISLYLY
jgi:hypothetical protein